MSKLWSSPPALIAVLLCGIPAWVYQEMSISPFPHPRPNPLQISQDLNCIPLSPNSFFQTPLATKVLQIYILSGHQHKCSSFLSCLSFLLLNNDPKWSLPKPKHLCVWCPASQKLSSDTISYVLWLQNKGCKTDAGSIWILFGLCCSKNILITTQEMFYIQTYISSFVWKMWRFGHARPKFPCGNNGASWVAPSPLWWRMPLPWSSPLYKVSMHTTSSWFHLWPAGSGGIRL